MQKTGSDDRGSERDLRGRGLSAKLLGLTLAFIMLAEALVFLPTIGRALQVYGEQVVIELERGALAFEIFGEDDPDYQVMDGAFSSDQAEALQMQLLADADWQAFAARFPGDRSILTGMPPHGRLIALDQANPLRFIGQALRLMTDFGAPKVLRFSGKTRDGTINVDVWLTDTPVRAELRAYAFRIFLISLGISGFAAALVYLSLRQLIVRPIERLRASLSRFAQAPQDPRALIHPSTRRDEIGFIEAETRVMQETIASTLQQKERLAALGSAVAQVNHDLRGMLSTALLLSDSLESSEDPRVAKAAPVLANSIEQAVQLCSATLKFAKGSDMPVQPRAMDLGEALAPLLADWRARWPGLSLRVEGGSGVQMQIDTGAFARVLDNLARNAVEAGSETLDLIWDADARALLIRDTGPGIPPKAQADLFVPFKGSTKREGTGLGVTNAADLAEAMGGSLSLQNTDASGTTFALTLAPAP